MGGAAETSPAAARRGGFDVDSGRALGALRLAWGDAYVVCFDDMIRPGGARWRAWRLDSAGMMITGTTPGELNAAIRADCTRGSET